MTPPEDQTSEEDDGFELAEDDEAVEEPAKGQAASRGVIDSGGLVDGRELVDGRGLIDGRTLVAPTLEAIIEEKYGKNVANAVTELCKEHKDDIYSIFVSARELKQYSDADVMIVFKNQKLIQGKNFEKIKAILEPFETDLTQFWLYYKQQYENNFENFECGTPIKPTNADWGPLARVMQLEWQAKKGEKIFGHNIPKDLRNKKNEIKELLTPEEAYEFLIVQTRKLADGVFRKSLSDMMAEGGGALADKKYKEYVTEKDLQLSKAILRAVDAYYLLSGDKKGLTADFDEMFELGQFSFGINAENFEGYNNLLRKAHKIRDQVKHPNKYAKEEKFVLNQTEIRNIYQFFRFVTEMSKQVMNDERDYPFNRERTKRLEQYYQRNTPALAEMIDGIKTHPDFGEKIILMQFYLEGMLSYLDNAPPDKTAKDIRELLKKIPNIGSDAIDGKIKLALGEYDEAKKHFKNFIAAPVEKEIQVGFQTIHPRHARAEIYKGLGLAELGLKDREEAKEAFEESIKLNPKDPGAWRGLYEATREQDYVVISDILSERSPIALDRHLAKHSELFGYWKKYLKDKIGKDLDLTKKRLEASRRTYFEDVYPASEEGEKLANSTYIDDVIKLNKKKHDVFDQLIQFQKEMLKKIEGTPVEYHNLEKEYYKVKRENFLDKILDYDAKLNDLQDQYRTTVDLTDSRLRSTLDVQNQVTAIEFPLAASTGIGLGECLGYGLSKVLPYINHYLPATAQIMPDNYVKTLLIGGGSAFVATMLWLTRSLCSEEARISFKAKVKSTFKKRDSN